MPCTLRLQVGTQSLAAYAYREGRRGTEIIWVLDEDKHKFDRLSSPPVGEWWKKGDIQLIANMIAAAQANESVLKIIAASQDNESVLNRVYPINIIGIKFNADCLYFYSACITEEYLDDLASEGKPSSALVVKKFPEGRELSLSVPAGNIFVFVCTQLSENIQYCIFW